MTRHLLVAEPDAALRELLVACARHAGWRADAVPTLGAALRLDTRSHTALLADVSTPDDLEVLAALGRRDEALVRLAMGARDRLDLALEARRRGAHAFLGKPFGVGALERALAGAAAAWRRGVARAATWLPSADPRMQRLLAEAEAAARVDATVQIVGEPGSGRRRLARFLHAAGRRRHGPLVTLDGPLLALDAGAPPAPLGAAHAPPARAPAPIAEALAAAAGGTLVLVEPAALGAARQRELLGGLAGAGRPPDVRLVVVATRPVADEPRLRPELRLRLDVLALHVPPLRERPRDIELLAQRFAEHIAAELGLDPPQLGPAALAALRRHRFSGNVVELENLMRRAVVRFAGGEVDGEALLANRGAPRSARAAVPAPADDGEGETLDLRELERRTIMRALAAHGGNRTSAARALGISVRTLRNKIRAWRLA